MTDRYWDGRIRKVIDIIQAGGKWLEVLSCGHRRPKPEAKKHLLQETHRCCYDCKPKEASHETV
jgi:hypothetical protein